ncbi:hypothetical protein DRA42_07805 [Ethanoligenens harbinense]|nr:hypothetical protein CXQ68_07775 [Ethanoligenens harbinense YUAN-3]AYF38792.1 hypothetical protein CXP51_07645 [Ethanoligenens harbinense]AYF41542.1 hypothetical protein CN246_07790 [Ethanoligenens harbinense]QCN92373.1 hypothetical protein DRA42_07805 [Ethanoligenens harbinense]
MIVWEMKCLLENGLENCTCPKSKCHLHGKCAECIERHKIRNELPRCKRMKKSIFQKLFK